MPNITYQFLPYRKVWPTVMMRKEVSSVCGKNLKFPVMNNPVPGAGEGGGRTETQKTKLFIVTCTDNRLHPELFLQLERQGNAHILHPITLSKHPLVRYNRVGFLTV